MTEQKTDIYKAKFNALMNVKYHEIRESGYSKIIKAITFANLFFATAAFFTFFTKFFSWQSEYVSVAITFFLTVINLTFVAKEFYTCEKRHLTLKLKWTDIVFDLKELERKLGPKRDSEARFLAIQAKIRNANQEEPPPDDELLEDCYFIACQQLGIQSQEKRKFPQRPHQYYLSWRYILKS